MFNPGILSHDYVLVPETPQAYAKAAVCQSEIHDAREWHGMGEQHSSAALVAGLA